MGMGSGSAGSLPINQPGFAGAETFHSGGTVGDPHPVRSIPISYLVSAPRLHSGIAADEYPAILQRGEKVISKGKAGESGNNGGGGGKTSVTINNYTGQQVQTKESKGPSGMREIEVMIGQALVKDGPASRALQSSYGLTRKGTMRG